MWLELVGVCFAFDFMVTAINCWDLLNLPRIVLILFGTCILVLIQMCMAVAIGHIACF